MWLSCCSSVLLPAVVDFWSWKQERSKIVWHSNYDIKTTNMNKHDSNETDEEDEEDDEKDEEDE